ncbi:MAG: MoaD/ThiS family protein [Actinomycetota bacterium]
MPVVLLRSPLRDLAGGNRSIELPGATVGQVLRALEASWPKTTGWVLDERGVIRRHVNVFLNGERASADAPVAKGDRMHVLASITGGSR